MDFRGKIAVHQRRIHGYIRLVLFRHARSLLTDTLREGVRSIVGRPLVFPSICAFLGSNVAFFLPLPYAIIVSVLLFLLIFSFSQMNLFEEKEQQRVILILISSSILFLYTFASVAYARFISDRLLDSTSGFTEEISRSLGLSSDTNQYDEFDGTIRSVRVSASGYRTCIIRLDQGADVLFGTSEEWPEENMRVGVLGVIGPISGPSNPGSFDRRDFYARQGVFAEISSHAGKIMPLSIERSSGSLIEFLQEIGAGMRFQLTKAWEASADREDATLLSAMLLGDTSEVDSGTKMDFRLLNLSHLTAVSGANIAYFLAPAVAALQSSGTSRRMRCLILLSFLFCIGFITGWSPSVSRAILISAVHLISRLLTRRFCPISSMFAAILLLVFQSPFCAVDIGFCLSASAALSIVLIARRTTEFFRDHGIPMFLSDLLGPVISAHIGMLPWMIVLAGRESIVLLTVNIFAGLLAEGISSLGLIITPISLAGTFARGLLPLSRLAFLPISGLLFLLRETAEKLSPLGVESFRLQSVHPILPISIALGIIVYMLPRSFLRRIIITGCAFLISFSLILHFSIQEEQPIATVIFFDVGQGDAALVILDNGKSLLIDAGNEAAGEYVILPALNYYGIVKPDICYLTHLHNDHGGGMLPLVLDQRLTTVFTPFISNRGELQNLFLEMDKSDIALNLTAKDDKMILSDSVSIHVIGPSGITESGGNRDSAILLLSVAQTDILFMGDAGFSEEDLILDDLRTGQLQELSVDVLKVGHHGSRYSSGEDFLLAVNPDVSVVSVGDNNYGHPSDEATASILYSDSILYRTDWDGAVIITIYTDRYEIITYQQE